VPLKSILWARNESVALFLSHGLRMDDQVKDKGEVLLKLAVEAMFVDVLRFFLERGVRKCNDKQATSYFSVALSGLLDSTAYKDDFIERKTLEELLQITTMLLQHNADPDIFVKQYYAPSITDRNLTAMSPDPRVRLLLFNARTVPTAMPKQSSSNASSCSQVLCNPLGFARQARYRHDDTPWRERAS
jgi:hypothetical protein